MTNTTKKKTNNFQFDRYMYLPYTIAVVIGRSRLGFSQAGTWHREKPRAYYSGTAEACWLSEVAFQSASIEYSTRG